MINSLFSQNSSALVQHYNPMQNSGINAQKMDAVKSVLANYDASNISTSDAKEIATQIKDIGIAPGRTLAIVFAGEGFNAASIGNQAGVEGQRPPPPSTVEDANLNFQNANFAPGWVFGSKVTCPNA